MERLYHAGAVVLKWLTANDHVLRSGKMGSQKNETQPSIRLVFSICLLWGSVYGAAMGSYGYWDWKENQSETGFSQRDVVGSSANEGRFKENRLEQRRVSTPLLQMTYSAIKVPLFLLVTLVVSLPSFFVINSLLGLRGDFSESLRAIISSQATFVMVMAAFLPVTLFWYFCSQVSAAAYSSCVLFNGLVFLISSLSSQWLLVHYYQDLVAKNHRHRLTVRLWLFLYAFVGIQAAYCMRPFVGSPKMVTSLFREDSFQNAYIRIWDMIQRVLGA